MSVVLVVLRARGSGVGSPLLGQAQQFAGADAEGVRQSTENVHCEAGLPALDTNNAAFADSHSCGELFLGHLPLPTKCDNGRSEAHAAALLHCELGCGEVGG